MHMKKTILFSLFLLFLGFEMQAQDNTAEEICPILVGTELPDAEVTDIDGNPVKISSLVAGKPTVMIVYRGSWCPYCNRHFGKLQEIEGELKEMGFQIMALSPDKPENLNKTIKKNDLEYTLVSDSKMNLIDALGLSFQVDEKTLKKYKLYGINLEKASGEAHNRLPVPAIIIANAEGIVTFTYVNPDYSVRADAGLVLAAAKAALAK